MSSVGFGLLRSLITSEDSFSELNNHDIDEQCFRDKELEAYSFIRTFVMDYGTYPNTTTVARHIGALDAFSGLENEPFEYWVREVKNRKRFNDLKFTMAQVRELAEAGRLEDAINSMGASYLDLSRSYGNRRMTELREVQQEVIEKHDRLQANPDIPGLPMGFSYLDAVSGGAQGGDYIIIVGQTGVGKTYLAFKMGLSAHLLANKNVLVVSTEIPMLQSGRRILAMEGNFSTTDLKMGRLSFYGREKAREIVERGALTFRDTGKYFYLLPGGMFSNIEDIVIITKEMRPDFLIVDGAYLVRAKAKSWWEKNMDVAAILKDLSMQQNIPILATYQYNKGDKGKLEDIGGGFAIPQIASIVYSFEYERKEDINSGSDIQYRILKLTKGRDGESGAIRVLYDMRRTSITQDRVLSGQVDPDDRVAMAERSRTEDDLPVEEI